MGRMFYCGVVLIVNFIFVIANGDIVFPCTTPNNEKAYCLSLFKCPHLIRSLATFDPDATNFVSQSICLGCEAGDFMVCCGKESNFIKLNDSSLLNAEPDSLDKIKVNSTTTNSNSSVQERREYVKKNLLPSSKICGQQHTDDRFNNGNHNIAEIDEFPWMVHVKTSSFDYSESINASNQGLDIEYGDRCSGFLINNRYVLTEPVCGSEGKRVYLGRYNSNQFVSCIETNTSIIQDCTEHVKELKVEETIFYGGFGQTSEFYPGRYTATLLRLNESVRYSDFIRPICLPLDDTQKEHNTYTISGWGSEGPSGTTKKKMNYDVVNNANCYGLETGQSVDSSDNLTEEVNSRFQSFIEYLSKQNATYLCLSSRTDNADKACSGDRGSPLMYKRKLQWYAEGIVHESDYLTCKSNILSGTLTTPTVVDWILDTIQK